MSSFLIALLAIVVTLLLVVGLHEAGHALAAKLCGVKIVRISIGFGKPIALWKARNGCEWVWAMLPFGGYVQLLNTRIAPVEEVDYPQCFDKKPVWMRLFILISGAAANVLVAWFVLTIFFMMGFERDIPVVETLVPNSIAANAGIREKDRIIAIAGQETNSWQDVAMRLIVNLGEPSVLVKVVGPSHSASVVTLDLRHLPVLPHNTLFSSVGFVPGSLNQNSEKVAGRTFAQASTQSVIKSWQLLCFFLLVLKQLLTGVLSFSMLLGPVSILAVSVGSFLQGLSVYLYFIASLSLAVGLVNLFPIPTLDGGSIIYALIEKIRGKPVSVALEVLIHRLVMIGLIILFVQLGMNDLQRYLH